MGLLILRSSSGEEEEALTGLQFPSNGGNTTRFHFSSPPNIVPLTIIWKLNPIQQTGFYTTWFWGLGDGTLITGDSYVGMHPFPPGGSGGSTHNWEIAIDGGDDTTDDNGNDTAVVKGQWYDQAGVVTDIGGNEVDAKFYWDLATSTTRLIDHPTSVSDFLLDLPASPQLFFGDAPWSEGSEMLSGILRGVQVYESALTLAQISARAALDTDQDVLDLNTTDGITSLWYLNMNPTPDDITDKSGNGNNPSWANANRPTLWEG